MALLALLWALMMLAWLGGLLLGLRGVWPLLQRPVTGELVIPMVWLVIGTAAWVVALNFGLQRFWASTRTGGRGRRGGG